MTGKLIDDQLTFVSKTSGVGRGFKSPNLKAIK